MDRAILSPKSIKSVKRTRYSITDKYNMEKDDDYRKPKNNLMSFNMLNQKRVSKPYLLERSSQRKSE